MCAKSIYSEIKDQENPKERVKLIVDMLKPISQTILNYEDQWNGMIYDYGDQKNLITSINHQELLGLTQLRIKYTTFFIEIAQKALDYECIKEIYKKKQASFKSTDEPATNALLFEVQILFEKSKNQYLQVLCEAIATALSKYKQLRNTVIQSMGCKEDNKWKTHSVKQAREGFESMKRELLVTKEHIPYQLKEVFDVFVDVHFKKGFLANKKLVTDE